MILGLKLGRRLVAAVGFDDEEMTFCDSRFVPAGREGLDRAFTKYFDHLIAQGKPTEIFYYAPTGPQTITDRLVAMLDAAAVRARTVATRLVKLDVFPSCGVPPPRTRRELRDCMSGFVSQIRENKQARQVVIAEAAAAALIGEVRHGLRAP